MAEIRDWLLGLRDQKGSGVRYEILVWLVARLFGFRLSSDETTQKVRQLLSPIDFIGSLGVGMLAALPVGAVISIVDLFVNNPRLHPWIDWCTSF